jgi:mannosyl-oligosaccharide alpha-1,2-mannosidase
LLNDVLSDGKTFFQSTGGGGAKITTSGIYVTKESGTAKSSYGAGATANSAYPVDVGSLNGFVTGLGGRKNIMSQSESDQQGRTRAVKVKEAMQFVWGNYRKHAWGKDELLPASGRGQDNWGSLGVTLVDSLDTLWVMGMKEEFDEASLWVKNKLDFSRTGQVSFFETTIRELGGLLSAHSLSKEQHFLDKAIILGDKLLPAFGSKSGLPYGQVNLRTGSRSNAGWTRGSILAEIGTVQLEFRYLTEHSGDAKYANAANKVYEVMSKIPGKVDGLCPIFVNPESGQFSGQQITLGALGDSYYEYLLKVWIQGGREETYIRNMYDESVDGMMKHLLQKSSPNKLSYFADYDKGSINRKMDHLACFTAGMLALGSHKQPDSERSKRDLEVAKALMYTCWQMYDRYDSGLAPEFVAFSGKNDFQPTSAPFYILRPETAESLFILHWITKDPIYREWCALNTPALSLWNAQSPKLPGFYIQLPPLPLFFSGAGKYSTLLILSAGLPMVSWPLFPHRPYLCLLYFPLCLSLPFGLSSCRFWKYSRRAEGWYKSRRSNGKFFLGGDPKVSLPPSGTWGAKS